MRKVKSVVTAPTSPRNTQNIDVKAHSSITKHMESVSILSSNTNQSLSLDVSIDTRNGIRDENEMRHSTRFGKGTRYYDIYECSEGHFSVGKIENCTFNEEGVDKLGKDIRLKPHRAFYRDGKALYALTSRWKNGL